MNVELVPLTVTQLDLLADYNLAAASESLSMPAPPYLMDGQWIWQNFGKLMRQEPEIAWWRTQYLVIARSGPTSARRIVGHVRFHYYADHEQYFPSRQTGEVHIGWAVDPVERGRGYAQAGTRKLLALAASISWLRAVVALIDDDKVSSQGVARGVGFERDGFQDHRLGRPMQRWIFRMNRRC